LKRIEASRGRNVYNPDDMIGRGFMRIDRADESSLVLAAWLYRTGEDALAARALANLPNRVRAVTALRQELAWRAFHGMVHAYMVRADDEALAHGERLLRLYSNEVSDDLAQGRVIVDDLKRRKKKGTFGRDPGKLPEGFNRWEIKKKVIHLIDALEEVDARQWGQPGGIDLGSDARVAALIEIGEPAVPALIDVIEKDKRLTRCVHFWRDFASTRTVLAIREPALVAVMSILRVQVFQIRSTGDNFTSRGEKGAREVARQLRAYWKKFGHLCFDERMMKVLTDPRGQPETWREAAMNLALLGQKRESFGTTMPDGTSRRTNDAKKQNPAITKFDKPTVAEAILAAMDRELTAHDGKPRDDLHDYARREIEDAYLEALHELNDRRVASEAAKRSRNARGRMRYQWAYLCHWLQEPAPLAAFATDFMTGKVKFADGEEGFKELRRVVFYFSAAATKDCDRALYALAERKHPYHDVARRAILAGSPDPFMKGVWFRHPYCLTILRQALMDTTPTLVYWKVEGMTVQRNDGHGWRPDRFPDEIVDPKARKDEAKERVCDAVALKLQELVFGMQVYHPLLKDSDKRLVEIGTFLDRFKERFRRLDASTAKLLGFSPDTIYYIPDIPPLARPASEEDVKAGRAVFHLSGKGKVMAQRFPARALWKGPQVLIVQAEIGPDGKVTYGVISHSGLRAVPAVELSDIRTPPN
jgi:hypothetical protein